jgi:hypothetical protein
MFKPRPVSCAMLLLAGLLCAGFTHTAAQAQAPTAEEALKQSTESATHVLQTATRVWPDGRQHAMLQTIRQMKDPRFAPFYEKLFNLQLPQSQPQMKIHGILGLTEIDPDKKLDLNRLASIKNVVVETEIVGALMEANALSDEQAQAIYTWNDLDPGVRVLVAVQLLAHDQKIDLAPIIPLSEKTINLPQQAMANYVLFLAGKEEGAKAMDALITLEDKSRDMMIDLLLRTAIKYKLKSVGPWAFKVAQHQAAQPRDKRALRLLIMALRTSLYFQVPGSGDLLTKLYQDAGDDTAFKIRLALASLYTFTETPLPFFELLSKASEPILRQIGLTAAALKTDSSAQQELDNLVKIAHPQTDEWILFWVGQKPTPKLAAPTLLAIINRANQFLKSDALVPNYRPEEQLDFASGAAQAAIELCAEETAPAIANLLKDPTTSLEMRQTLYMGLIKVRGTPQAQPMLKLLPPESDPRLKSLSLIFQASHGIKLSPDDLHDLGVFVQGGGIPLPVLRLIAGIHYLDQTNQLETVINKISK